MVSHAKQAHPEPTGCHGADLVPVPESTGCRLVLRGTALQHGARLLLRHARFRQPRFAVRFLSTRGSRGFRLSCRLQLRPGGRGANARRDPSTRVCSPSRRGAGSSASLPLRSAALYDYGDPYRRNARPAAPLRYPCHSLASRASCRLTSRSTLFVPGLSARAVFSCDFPPA